LFTIPFALTSTGRRGPMHALAACGRACYVYRRSLPPSPFQPKCIIPCSVLSWLHQAISQQAREVVVDPGA